MDADSHDFVVPVAVMTASSEERHGSPLEYTPTPPPFDSEQFDRELLALLAEDEPTTLAHSSSHGCLSVGKHYHLLDCGHFIKTIAAAACSSICQPPDYHSFISPFACPTRIGKRVLTARLERKGKFMKVSAHTQLAPLKLEQLWKQQEKWDIEVHASEEYQLVQDAKCGRRECEKATRDEAVAAAEQEQREADLLVKMDGLSTIEESYEQLQSSSVKDADTMDED